MPSRLSSLLVRDGLVRVASLEYVFQRQVIHGGSLDTILLELKLVDEARLQQYLSLATGLPPANGEVRNPHEQAASTCNKDLASKYQVVPLTFEEGSLGVLVCDPVDLSKLEGLADELDLSVQPMVVPEYQFQVMFAEVFGVDADSRFTDLAAASTIPKSETRSPSVEAPPSFSESRARAAVEEASAIPHAIEPESTKPADTSERVRGTRAPAEQPKRRQTLEMNTVALREHAEATEALAADAPKVVIDLPPDKPPANLEETVKEPPAETVAPPVEPTSPAEAPIAQAPDISEIAGGYSAITADDARKLLLVCDDRDEIFATLLRAIHRRTKHALLLTIKGKTAIGRLSLSAGELDREVVKGVSVPLDVPSPFQTVLETKSFCVSSLETDDPGLKAALELLGGAEAPKSALLLPILMRDRVIAIAVGHNEDKGVSMARVPEILPLGTATADAVSRLLAAMRAKKAKASEPAATATTEPVAAEAASSVPQASEEMTSLFARLEDDDSSVFEAACQEALQRAEEALAHLEFHFPGKLIIERDEDAEPKRAAEHGPVLDMVVRIGVGAGPALAEKMRDANREVRYYATLCASELRPNEVLHQFVERLFDGDQHIRALAVSALGSYPSEELHVALDFARKALHSEDNLRLKVAADGLAKLADLSAIPDLIDAHSRGGEAAAISRIALFELTNQDFGTSNRKWRNWWTKNEAGSRIEWMLDGLANSNTEARKHASEILRSLTGEYFGYGHDLPKKEREKKRKQWWSWWDETGRDLHS